MSNEKEHASDLAAGRSAGRADEGDWTPVERELPPEGTEVMTLSSGGLAQSLVRKSGLWFIPDMSSYVYYQPLLWKPMLPE